MHGYNAMITMPDTADDFERLLEQAAAGEPDAIQSLLERYLTGLRGFIRLRAGPLIREREEVSDLVQTVCVEVMKKMDRFQHGGETEFKHWLYATALRQVRNRVKYWRREKRSASRELSFDSKTGGPGRSGMRDLLDTYTTLTTPSRRLMSGEEVRRIEAAFDLLSDDHKRVITLARLVGLSHQEIAAKMGRSEEAVRALLHRALAALTELLEE